jgi:multidrug efflux pump subunit AcrA (membrane-fusion protein)
VQSRFILEPVSRAALRAEVPGTVMEVMADEGQRVTAGETIAQLSDLRLESEVASAASRYQIAVARNNQSRMQYAGYGPAEQEEQQLAETNRLLGSRAQHLRIVSPISGVVVSPHVRDLVGSYVSEGTPIAEIADVSALRARIFVPEPEIQKMGVVAGIRLRVESFIAPLKAQLISITPKPHELEPGLFAEAKYKDVRPVVYYEAIALVPNPDGRLRDGMTGTAKISGRRRSVVGMALQPIADFIGRKVW